MTHREDDALLSTVSEWLDAQDEIQRGYRDAEAMIAFAIFLLLLFAALHIGPVL